MIIRVGERSVNLLEAGHRAADAVARSTELGGELEGAFRSYAAGDAEPLAQIAPTSLVFGAWDSRGSQAKAPRLINATIRAFDVRRLRRAAQYFAALESDEVQPFVGADPAKERKALSKAGFLDAPSGVTHGGILVRGDIVRTSVLNLTALRSLGASSPERQTALRRYILGLTLVAAFAPSDLFLRQGCLLVGSTKAPLRQLIYRDGRREDCSLTLEQAAAFAREAAAAFGVGSDRTVDFDPGEAKKVLAKAKKEKADS